MVDEADNSADQAEPAALEERRRIAEENGTGYWDWDDNGVPFFVFDSERVFAVLASEPEPPDCPWFEWIDQNKAKLRERDDLVPIAEAIRDLSRDMSEEPRGPWLPPQSLRAHAVELLASQLESELNRPKDQLVEEIYALSGGEREYEALDRRRTDTWVRRLAALEEFLDNRPADMTVEEGYVAWIECAGPLWRQNTARLEVDTIRLIWDRTLSVEPIWDANAIPDWAKRLDKLHHEGEAQQKAWPGERERRIELGREVEAEKKESRAMREVRIELEREAEALQKAWREMRELRIESEREAEAERKKSREERLVAAEMRGGPQTSEFSDDPSGWERTGRRPTSWRSLRYRLSEWQVVLLAVLTGSVALLFASYVLNDDILYRLIGAVWIGGLLWLAFKRD